MSAAELAIVLQTSFDIHEAVRVATAGKCTTPADGAPMPGTICPCCCRLINAKKDRIAIQHGVVRHEACR
jgi:hypothetical protein